MKRLVAAAVGCIVCGAVSAGAVQLTLDRRAIEEAIYIGQSRIESERTRFHVPYRVRVTQPPVDWIDVITPFHRVELAAETNARSGGRMFGQREAMDALRDCAESDRLGHRDELPSAQHVRRGAVVSGGDHRAGRPSHRAAAPRSIPAIRAAIGVDRSRAADAERQCRRSAAGQPVVGGTMIAALDGSTFDPNQRVEVVVLDGKTELARAAVDLAKMR